MQAKPITRSWSAGWDMMLPGGRCHPHPENPNLLVQWAVWHDGEGRRCHRICCMLEERWDEKD